MSDDNVFEFPASHDAPNIRAPKAQPEASDTVSNYNPTLPERATVLDIRQAFFDLVALIGHQTECRVDSVMVEWEEITPHAHRLVDVRVTVEG